jgi:hypothetical protein
MWRRCLPTVCPGWQGRYQTATGRVESLSGNSHAMAGFERVNGKSGNGQAVNIPRDCVHGRFRSRQFDQQRVCSRKVVGGLIVSGSVIQPNRSVNNSIFYPRDNLKLSSFKYAYELLHKCSRQVLAGPGRTWTNKCARVSSPPVLQVPTSSH